VRIHFLFLLLVCSTRVVVNAQVYVGTDANSLVIKSAETFYYDGLSITPTADFILTNTTLTKTEDYTITPTPIGTYIKRYFSFNNTTPAYSGTLRFSYSGAVIPSPLSAGSLQLNIRTASAWTAVSGTDVGAGGGSYVEATSVSSTGLNTLTLASNTGALPVTWLRFVGEKNKGAVLLSWSTASEQNTKDFLIQHSTNGSGWITVGSTKAAGNTTTRTDYSFIHHTPLPGYNYYRLIQRDRDSQFSYSKVVTVLMQKNDIELKVFPNPVLDGKLNVLLKDVSHIRIFNAAGRQVFSQFFVPGLQTLDVSHLANGVYILKANAESIRIIISR